MKRLLLSISMFLVTAVAFAQSEAIADSISAISLDGSHYKSFDGFILDMGPMTITPPPLVSPQLTYQPYSSNGTIKNYNEIFRPGQNVTYDRGSYSMFMPIYSGISFGRYGWGGIQPTLQSATFKLKNGLQITTYGEYDADGNKVWNQAALPWEKNNFNGAFEMKSENGNFGIRIEVQRGRNTPY